MADTRLKHKPNEKHTLDEVLKSLRDLVSNEVLDKPRPREAVPKSAPPPATTMEMGDIISSLERLLANDLDIENRPVPPATPQTEAPSAKISVTPKAKTPAPTVAEVQEAIEAEETIESELTIADETPLPEPTLADEAPALELIVEEPVGAPAKSVQQELPLSFGHFGSPTIDAKRSPISTEVGLPTIEVEETPLAAADETAFASDMAAELEAIADEIVATPAPSETAPAANAYSVEFESDADATPAESAEVTAELTIEAAPAPDATTETVEYTSSAKTTLEPDSAESRALETPTPSTPDVAQTSASAEEPAPPAHDESPTTDDSILNRFEPPTPAEVQTGDSDSGSSLGGVVDFDLSAPAPESAAATIRPTTPIDDIPVLEDVALAPPKANRPAPISPSSPDRVREMAVRVIARLNIELRKAGKPPFDAKTVNRLHQLLCEAMEKDRESEKSKVKS